MAISDSQQYPLNLFLINYELDIHVVSEILEKLSQLSTFQARNTMPIFKWRITKTAKHFLILA